MHTILRASCQQMIPSGLAWLWPRRPRPAGLPAAACHAASTAGLPDAAHPIPRSAACSPMQHAAPGAAQQHLHRMPCFSSSSWMAAAPALPPLPPTTNTMSMPHRSICFTICLHAGGARAGAGTRQRHHASSSLAAAARRPHEARTPPPCSVDASLQRAGRAPYAPEVGAATAGAQHGASLQVDALHRLLGQHHRLGLAVVEAAEAVPARGGERAPG